MKKPKIRDLQKHYAIDDIHAVKDYIKHHHKLGRILLEAPSVLQHHFPGAEFSLRVAHLDRNYQQLLIEIHTDLEAQEALSRLDDFDESWFLDADERSGFSFNVTLTYDEREKVG